MSDAIVGVIVGALATGGFNLLVQRQREKSERRKERRELEADREQQAREVRISAQLLGADVADAQQRVDEATKMHPPRKRGEWPIGVSPNWTQTWIVHSRAMADALSVHDFANLASVYARMDQLQRGLAAPRDDRTLSPNDQVFLTEVGAMLPSAREMLERYAEAPQAVANDAP
jgi:hypothetical protein